MIPRSTAPLFSCSTLSRSAPPGGGGTFWGAMGLLFQTLAAIVEKVFEPLNREQTNEGRFREMPPAQLQSMGRTAQAVLEQSLSQSLLCGQLRDFVEQTMPMV